MKIAVLLTCHNRKEKTLECLKHLYEQSVPDTLAFDVILVDDGSTDGTSAAIRKSYPNVNLIQGDGELFWNRGMHKAWTEALKEDYSGVLWLNDDTNLNHGALSTVFEYADKYNNCIIVGTICSISDPKVITYGGFRYLGKNKKHIMDPSKSDIYCDQFNGNLVYVPASIYKEIGILDEYYRHSFGDFEYGRRANMAGFKCVITPIVGSCDRNPPLARWNKGNLCERFKKLYSPLGNNPFETFHYFRKESFLLASTMFLYMNLRALLAPQFPAKDDDRK